MPIALPPRSVYAITHRGLARGHSHVEQVRQLLAGGARIIQVREKDSAFGPQALEGEVRRCVELCRAAGALLIVNDDARLAALCGAHGVHVGQGDMSPAEARGIVGPDRLVGVSTHSPVQFDAAMEQPVDYIAVGPVFGTTTKENPDPTTGLALVEYAARRLSGDRRGLVAIGGIDAGNMRALLTTAPRVIPAAIGSIVGAPDPAAALRRLQAIVGELGA